MYSSPIPNGAAPKLKLSSALARAVGALSIKGKVLSKENIKSANLFRKAKIAEHTIHGLHNVGRNIFLKKVVDCKKIYISEEDKLLIDKDIKWTQSEIIKN